MPTLTGRWRAMSVAAAPMSGFAKASSKRLRPTPTGWEADHARTIDRSPRAEIALTPRHAQSRTWYRWRPVCGLRYSFDRQALSAGHRYCEHSHGGEGRDRAVYAQRLHPHRAKRRHHADHADGRDGSGHLYVARHA